MLKSVNSGVDLNDMNTCSVNQYSESALLQRVDIIDTGDELILFLILAHYFRFD